MRHRTMWHAYLCLEYNTDMIIGNVAIGVRVALAYPPESQKGNNRVARMSREKSARLWECIIQVIF